MREKFRAAYERGMSKVRHLMRTLDAFPHATRDGVWLTHQRGHWTGGFWTGLVWLNAMHIGDAEAFRQAKAWAMRLGARTTDNKTHDQGFIFGPSCVLGYNLTHDPDFLPLIQSGARNMGDLYNEQSGLMLAWDEPGYEGVAIVDTIMNLPLLAVADKFKGGNAHASILQSVADNIRQYNVRGDFSTYHVVRWDERYAITGDTHQGHAVESCWSRGQAWALYGFANLYRYTGDESYLATSRVLADYYFSHLNDDFLPAWDFDFRNTPGQPIDAASASIAAAGLALSAWLHGRKGDPVGKARDACRAHAILEALIDQCLYTDIERYGIIEKVTVDLPRGSGIGESTMYGDYYFMEALYRLRHLDSNEKTELLY